MERTQTTQKPQMNADYLYREETDEIIAAFYEVYHVLGAGFLERVYENALYFELLERGFKCEAQRRIQVRYKEHVVGDYVADMVVNDHIILELKAIEAVTAANEYQLVNYLRATGIKVGLLLNFGPRPQVKRKVNTGNRNLCSSAASALSAFKSKHQ